jgi:hypothetical protein
LLVSTVTQRVEQVTYGEHLDARVGEVLVVGPDDSSSSRARATVGQSSGSRAAMRLDKACGGRPSRETAHEAQDERTKGCGYYAPAGAMLIHL